jgi:hypothetical protein
MYKWMGFDASSASKNSNCDTRIAESVSLIFQPISFSDDQICISWFFNSQSHVTLQLFLAEDGRIYHSFVLPYPNQYGHE